jgi:predicted SPOUT superfamily RNA methylase MTH1
MKSFQQFITEAQGKDDYALTPQRKPGEGGRIRASRKKTEPEKRRTKVVGGGKTVPAKDYKPRKDIGTNKPRSQREQQPTKERGSAALSAKEAQRKAYKERKARESGAKTKTASELLTKKTTKADSKYKATGKSGYGGPSKKSYSHQERHALRRKGEKVLRDLRLKNLGKKSEKELKHKIVSK